MDEYDFMVVELDALAASVEHSGKLRNIVTEHVDKLFKQSIRDDILNWPEHKPKTINGYILDETIKLTWFLEKDKDKK